MTTPTTNIIVPRQGKVTTRSGAGGKMAAKTGSRAIPKISNNFDGAPKKAQGKESTAPPWVTTGSELDGPPSDDQDGTLTKDSSATKRTTRKATKQAVKDKKVKKMRLLQAQKEEEERLWDEYSTQEDGSNQTFVAACAKTKNQEKKARQTQGKRTKRVESSESSGEGGYPVESETDDDREGSLPSTNDEESVVTEPATKKAKDDNSC
jgi:hypothetical protein